MVGAQNKTAYNINQAFGQVIIMKGDYWNGPTRNMTEELNTDHSILVKLICQIRKPKVSTNGYHRNWTKVKIFPQYKPDLHFTQQKQSILWLHYNIWSQIDFYN